MNNTFDTGVLIDYLEDALGNIGCVEDALTVQYNYLTRLVSNTQLTEISPLLALAKTLRAIQEDLERLLHYVS